MQQRKGREIGLQKKKIKKNKKCSALEAKRALLPGRSRH
jgi:hypothetical protein